MTDLVEVYFPGESVVGTSALFEELSGAEPLRYFDGESVAYLAALSRRLMRDSESKGYPELVALGYFLRRSALDELRRSHLSDHTAFRKYPVGFVFHLPPANVDTMFVYSWALSLLCGNTNVVRLSTRAGQAARVIVRLLNETLGDGDFERVSQTQRVVSYGHIDDVTAAMSLQCDLRVVWGGDESVRTIRRFQLRPSGRDITFPDRHSFAVVSAEAYARLDPSDRRRVAERLYNDVFWFDQAGCSSPRWLLWVDDHGSTALDSLRSDLAAHLQAVIEAKRYRVETGMAIEKLVSTYGEIMVGHLDAMRQVSNELTTVWSDEPADLPRRYLGAGVIAESRISKLSDIAPLVLRSDQTVAHFGFTLDEITELADLVNGRGVDRLVPIGQALAFSSVWDGLDLVSQMTRIVELRDSRPQPSGLNPHALSGD